MLAENQVVYLYSLKADSKRFSPIVLDKKKLDCCIARAADGEKNARENVHVTFMTEIQSKVGDNQVVISSL